MAASRRPCARPDPASSACRRPARWGCRVRARVRARRRRPCRTRLRRAGRWARQRPDAADHVDRLVEGLHPLPRGQRASADRFNGMPVARPRSRGSSATAEQVEAGSRAGEHAGGSRRGRFSTFPDTPIHSVRAATQLSRVQVSRNRSGLGDPGMLRVEPEPLTELRQLTGRVARELMGQMNIAKPTDDRSQAFAFTLLPGQRVATLCSSQRNADPSAPRPRPSFLRAR